MRLEAIFSQPQRQSPFAILFILLKLGRNLVRYGWPVLLILFFNSKGSSPWTTVYGLFLVFAVLSAISSIAAYFRFYFYIKDGELIIERGIFQHTRVNIPFEKIQTVNFRQNVFHQALGVVQLEIDTAGSAQSELSIEALDREQAVQLRSFLMENRGDFAQIEEDSESPPPTESNLTEILHLQVSDLLRIGISQNHLRTAGILLAFIVGLLENLEEFTGFRVYDEIGDSILHFSLAFLFRILIWGAFLLFISFFGSLILTTIRYYGLRLWQSDKGFKLEAGLFERREKSVQLHRVQFLKWTQNLLQRQLKLHQLSLFRASGLQNNDNSRSAIVIPGAKIDQITRLQQAYFPNFNEEQATKHGISKKIIRRRMILIGILPLVLLWLLKWDQWIITLVISLFWLYFIWRTSKAYHQNWQYWLHSEGLLTQSGIFGRQHYFLKWPHIQSIRIKQSWYQKRKKLASIHFHTAAGVVRIPYIPLKQANQIRDYCLYYLESRNMSWM